VKVFFESYSNVIKSIILGYLNKVKFFFLRINIVNPQKKKN